MNSVQNDTEASMFLIEQAAMIVASYVAKNPVSPTDLPKLIGDVHTALVGLGKPAAELFPEQAPTPAVSIRKSVTPDYLVCLDDGMKLKSLRRHLSKLGMTPEQYRAKWGLPADYPMVAPNYSAVRSALAKDSGLGKKR